MTQEEEIGLSDNEMAEVMQNLQTCSEELEDVCSICYEGFNVRHI